MALQTDGGIQLMRFNIAGAFSKSVELKLYFVRNKPLIKKLNLTVYDGINNCSWNGGRINRDIYYDDDTVDFYYRNNINIALTFTNPVIDINDRVGNELLEKFHRAGNVIISINDELLSYVRDLYPLYKHTRSITGFGKISVPMSDQDMSLYRELESRYDYIVPRCEHVFDERFVDLTQSKYEVMLNDTCLYNCPYYGQHFEAIAEQNRLYEKPWEEAGQKKMYDVEECWLSDRSTYLKSSGFDPDIGHEPTIDKYGDEYGMDLKDSQIKFLIERGISNFKITGREMTFNDYNNELNRYLRNYNESDA